LTLNIDPYVEQDMNSIETIFPGRSLFFKHLVVWRELHSRERVEVLAALREEIVPTSNQPSLVLIIDEVESVVRPSLLDLSENASALDSKRECVRSIDEPVSRTPREPFLPELAQSRP